jgi:ribosomal-protein-alanine N-acetyltransferase
MRERVRLLEVSDSHRLAELLTENRDFLAPWEPIRGEEYFTEAGQREDVREALERHAGGSSFPLVILNDDGRVVGRLTLNGITRGAFLSCSMGYWVAQNCNGRGYASGAVEAALALAFDGLGLHRVQAETLLHNAASQRVLTKAGFQEYGLSPRYLRIAGEWQDHLMYQRLNETPS